ncbi:MAG: type IIA DNA topoisomerase subunit B [SAR324 cluster bacterium]|nr:type IIA DNA topoisomerase subunit B [SAR324 cluster bacterium]
MYIGRLGNGSHPTDGIYVLLKEIIDNAIDEYIMGFGKKIQITIRDNRLSVRDYGRGIPQGKLVECVSTINTGAKYNSEVFQFSVGLNGVGTKAVNALSQFFSVTSFREGYAVNAQFSKGTLTATTPKTPAKEKDGTLVEYVADSELFPSYTYDHEFIEKLLWNYAYLNSGLTLTFNGQTFKSENGLLDLLAQEVKEDHLYDIVHFRGKSLEYSFTHTDNYGEDHYSFVNGQYTNSGGTHLSAFREGMLKGLNQFFKANYDGPDVRDGLIGAVSVKVKEPIFESQTKNKLGNTDVRAWIVPEVRDSLVDYLYKHPDIADQIKQKVLSNERIRKELMNVKKAARDNSKKTALTIPNLKDCKFHLNNKNGRGEESMIFITEGQSAGGSMISSRDVMTQAIFCLKGKPLNCWGLGRETIYKNAELYNIMKALGIEDDIEDLRYNKIIIATDADVDGLHIRNLLLTFFLQYFETLVQKGHVYILETPLFRVRNQKITQYCYSDEEKEKSVIKLKKGSGLEITRFKGLGEISPKEFGQFIGKSMRAVPVGIEHTHDVKDLLNFYMGTNTSERKRYIMDHLV